jgi:hypothetical protein
VGIDYSQQPVYFRPAQAGDICILLEPTDRHEIDHLRRLQAALQRRYGGTPIERIHLACQRFACAGEAQLQGLIRSLADTLAGVSSPTFAALSLDTLYVSLMDTNTLRWRIQVTEGLRELSATFECVLHSKSIDSLYRPGFVSSLIAALKDMPEVDRAHLGGVDLPCELFTARQAILSRILGPNEFEILTTLRFAHRRRA